MSALFLPPHFLLLFFCSIVTFFSACNKRNLMPKPYMQISFSLLCVLGRQRMIREIHGGQKKKKKAIYCKELLYCKVILVFQGKGTSSQGKLHQLRLSLQFSLHAVGASDGSGFVGVCIQPSISVLRALQQHLCLVNCFLFWWGSCFPGGFYYIMAQGKLSRRNIFIIDGSISVLKTLNGSFSLTNTGNY